MSSRAATDGDVDRVVECLTLAFQTDPVWGVALARPDGSTSHHASFWRSYVEGALRYATVFTTDDVSAVSVWIPPGGTELSEQQEADVVRLVEGSLAPARRGFTSVLDDAPISTMWRAAHDIERGRRTPAP